MACKLLGINRKMRFLYNFKCFFNIFTIFKHILFLEFLKHTQILLYRIWSQILSKDKPPCDMSYKRRTISKLKLKKVPFSIFTEIRAGGGRGRPADFDEI